MDSLGQLTCFSFFCIPIDLYGERSSSKVNQSLSAQTLILASQYEMWIKKECKPFPSLLELFWNVIKHKCIPQVKGHGKHLTYPSVPSVYILFFHPTHITGK